MNQPMFETIIVEDVRVCDHLLREKLGGAKFVGFDCEWIAKKKISLLQIATLDTVLLIRLNRMTVITEKLENFLSDPEVLKFGVSISRDGEKLQSDHKIKLGGKVDLRKLMKFTKPYQDLLWRQIQEFERGLNQRKQFQPHFNIPEQRRSWKPKLGLAALSAEVLSLNMDKTVELRAGNWNCEELSEEQKQYAALDAWTAIKLAHCFAAPELRPELQTQPQIEARLADMCSTVTDRAYNEKLDFTDLMKALHKDHPALKIKDYIPGRLTLCVT